MKITVLHWTLMGLGVVAIIVEGFLLYRAYEEIKEKDATIATLQPG